MNVLKLPFNKVMTIKKSDVPNTILMLEDHVRYQNHLGTVHASAQYALAEASSGEIVERTFGDWNGAYFPVVRRVEVKYRNLAKGRLFSTGFIDPDRVTKSKEELSEKGRTLVDVSIKIVDEGHNITLEGTFTWFIQKPTGKKGK
jgi:acyl-coenzyme A thioesterase PaaI-like protein